MELGCDSSALLQSAQTRGKVFCVTLCHSALSLESLAGGESKGGEDLRASIPPVARRGCDL